MPTNASSQTRRLLFIEDEEDVAGPIKRGLEEEGYLVDWTRKGEEGLTEALAGTYVALIVDWRLPGMDGRTLIEQLRDEGDTTPVLMLTALQDVSPVSTPGPTTTSLSRFPLRSYLPASAPSPGAPSRRPPPPAPRRRTCRSGP